MVFLPGLTADHTLFDEQLARFSPKYRCLVWDAPGHGASRPYAQDFTLDEMAGVLREIFLREGVRVPVMVGQSYGGYITQVYDALWPEELRAFVSIDSCSLKEKYTPKWARAMLRHTRGMYLAIPWPILMTWSVRGLSVSPEGRRSYRQTMEGYSRREFCDLCGRGFASLAEAIEVEGRSYDMSCPTLLLCGQQDRVGLVKPWNRAWSRGEGYPLSIIPQAGHNANQDAPEFVNATIEEFLAKL